MKTITTTITTGVKPLKENWKGHEIDSFINRTMAEYTSPKNYKTKRDYNAVIRELTAFGELVERDFTKELEVLDSHLCKAPLY